MLGKQASVKSQKSLQVLAIISILNVSLRALGRGGGWWRGCSWEVMDPLRGGTPWKILHRWGCAFAELRSWFLPLFCFLDAKGCTMRSGHHGLPCPRPKTEQNDLRQELPRQLSRNETFVFLATSGILS